MECPICLERPVVYPASFRRRLMVGNEAVNWSPIGRRRYLCGHWVCEGCWWSLVLHEMDSNQRIISRCPICRCESPETPPEQCHAEPLVPEKQWQKAATAGELKDRKYITKTVREFRSKGGSKLVQPLKAVRNKLGDGWWAKGAARTVLVQLMMSLGVLSPTGGVNARVKLSANLLAEVLGALSPEALELAIEKEWSLSSALVLTCNSIPIDWRETKASNSAEVATPASFEESDSATN